MFNKTLFGALSAAALLAACASEPAPRPMPAPMPMAAAPAPAPMPAAPMGDGRMADIMFDGSSTDLNDAGRTSLGPVADRLGSNPRSRVTIMTHADRAGAGMARTRAAAVRQAMIDRGVAANRIRVVAGRPMRGMDPSGVHVMVR